MKEYMQDSMSERLLRLEQSNRRWKHGVAAVALVAVVGVGGAAQKKEPAPELDVHRITLRDINGVIRGVLGLRADGSVGIDLNDDQGAKHLGISVSAKGGARISLRNQHDNQLVEVYCDDSPETAGFVVHDSVGKLHTGFGIRKDRQAGMTIVEERPAGHINKLAALLVMPDGTTQLDLRSAAHSGSTLLINQPKMGPGILVKDINGKVKYKDP